MIVVVGPTGNTGSELIRELTRRGQRVRAAGRDPGRIESVLCAAGVAREAFDVVTCDLREPATFDTTLDGAARLYVAVGGATGTPELVDVECRFIDAAKRAGVSHYVKVSGIDSLPDSPSTIQRWHATIVQHLRRSGLGHTVLEPSFFMQNFLGLAPMIRSGVLSLPTAAARAGLIDARDVARVAAHVLTEDGHLGARYVLTGPELLSHADAAHVFSCVLERAVSFQDLPADAFQAILTGAGLPEWFAFLLSNVYGTTFRSGAIARVTGDVERLTGRAPCSLATFVNEHRAAFA